VDAGVVAAGGTSEDAGVGRQIYFLLVLLLIIVVNMLMTCYKDVFSMEIFVFCEHCCWFLL
jgi:hypothetical protein